ncbi:hypothetical protein EDD85DRAFT_863014 [Armillaria nabsnona]|nr:hypothetical protein EDD85DRAFT_863014 [Armillaria nabsnona]
MSGCPSKDKSVFYFILAFALSLDTNCCTNHLLVDLCDWMRHQELRVWILQFLRVLLFFVRYKWTLQLQFPFSFTVDKQQ